MDRDSGSLQVAQLHFLDLEESKKEDSSTAGVANESQTEGALKSMCLGHVPKPRGTGT